jgi:hypothetical protein
LWTPKLILSHNVTWDLGHVQIALETQNLSCSKHSSLYGIQNFHENTHMLQIQGSHLIIILIYTWAITTHNSNNNHTLISLMQLVILVHSDGCKQDTMSQHDYF